MIQVRRLGHATLTTPDLAPQIEYYTEVVGLTLVERDKTRAVFASKQGQEAIALELGAPNALARLAFQVAPGSDLAALAREPRPSSSRIRRTPRSRFSLTMSSPRRTRARPASCRSSSVMWRIA
jgi:catechol 2,3-dioxygenase-like lactoylglutathione lyase family enzyme